MLAQVEPESRRQLYLTVAVSSVLSSQFVAARLSAERALSLSEPGSQEEARARLYRAAALVADPKGFDDATAISPAPIARSCRPSDQALYDMVQVTHRRRRLGHRRATPCRKSPPSPMLTGARRQAGRSARRARKRRAESGGRHAESGDEMIGLAKLMGVTSGPGAGQRQGDRPRRRAEEAPSRQSWRTSGSRPMARRAIPRRRRASSEANRCRRRYAGRRRTGEGRALGGPRRTRRFHAVIAPEGKAIEVAAAGTVTAQRRPTLSRRRAEDRIRPSSGRKWNVVRATMPRPRPTRRRDG